MMPWVFGSRVTVQRSTVDRFNDRTYTDHHQIDGCIDYPTATTEAGVTNTLVTRYRDVLMPYGSDVLATDRILIHPAGVDLVPPDDPVRKTNIYQVVGAPKDWQHAFTGWQAGTQVSLERIT